MKDAAYERLVTSLEARYAKTIATEAAHGLRRLTASELGTDEAHQLAHDEVFNALLNDSAWTDVEAADISDIAYEAATEAQRNA